MSVTDGSVRSSGIVPMAVEGAMNFDRKIAVTSATIANTWLHGPGDAGSVASHAVSAGGT